MTLVIHSEEDSERQLKVTIEVPEERVQKQMRSAARALARDINIPGFRPGKAPYNVIVQRVGADALRADSIQDMLDSVVEEALEEIEVTPYRPASLDDLEMDPFLIKLTVPLEPKVVLGDYRAIRKEVEQVQVTEEALNESLENIRNHHQILEQVERPAELGDLITVSGEGKLDDEDGGIIWQEENTDLVMDPEKIFPDLPFVENLLGMSAEEEKEFSFTFPEETEEEELAGKSVFFQVRVSNVQSRELPELNDDLAQKEGDYQTLAEMTEAISKELLEQAERQAKSDLMDEVVDEMLAEAEIVFPPAVVDAELDNRMESFQEQITRSGWQWQDWLTLQSESEDSLKESWREDAIEGVRRGLVLGHFIEQEMITVEMADIDEKVDTVLERFGDNEELKEQLRSIYTQGQGLQSLSNDIVMEKAQERIEAIVTGNAPDLDALAQTEESADEEE